MTGQILLFIQSHGVCSYCSSTHTPVSILIFFKPVWEGGSNTLSKGLFNCSPLSCKGNHTGVYTCRSKNYVHYALKQMVPSYNCPATTFNVCGHGTVVRVLGD